MSLKSLKLPTETVTLPGGESFAVRGLSLVDITAIVKDNAEAVSALFLAYQTKMTTADGAPDQQAATMGFGQGLMEAAPGIAALVIAHAAGGSKVTGEEVEIAANLPFPVQVEALEKIGKLTFDAEGGPIKVVETVLRVFRGVTGLLGDLRTSQAGLLASAGK